MVSTGSWEVGVGLFGDPSTPFDVGLTPIAVVIGCSLVFSGVRGIWGGCCIRPLPVLCSCTKLNGIEPTVAWLALGGAIGLLGLPVVGIILGPPAAEGGGLLVVAGGAPEPTLGA